MDENGVKRFLRIKVAQWYYLIIERPTRNRYGLPYKVTFYKTFYGMGAHSGSLAICETGRHSIAFNMKKIMPNKDNLPGLEALVIHEICHILEEKHNPYFDKIYERYAGKLSPAIDTLVM